MEGLQRLENLRICWIRTASLQNITGSSSKVMGEIPYMMRNKRTLLVERLDLLNLAYIALRRSYFDRVYIVSESSVVSFLRNLFKKNTPGAYAGYKKIEFADLPGSYFDTLEEATQQVNGALFEKYIKNIYFDLLTRFCDDDNIRHAATTELNVRYTVRRVKPYIFLKYILETGSEVTFFPADNEKIAELFSDTSKITRNYSVPRFIRLKNSIADVLFAIIMLIATPVVLTGVSLKIASRGIELRATPKKEFRYGFDMLDAGIHWKKGYHQFFIYDNDQFRPSKIIHVIRGTLNDKKTRDFLETNRFPYTEFNRQKASLGFYIRRVIVDFLIKSCIREIVQCFRSNCKPFFFLPSLACMKMLVEAEIFYEHFNIRVFISRDDFNSFHVVRTIVAHKNHNYTVGFNIGDYSIRSINTIFYDRYAIWGDFYRDFHAKSLQFTTPVVIGAGIYGLDKTYALAEKHYVPFKYRELKGKHRLILIFGTSHAPDLFITKEMQLKFYSAVLDATDPYDDVIRIIKPKMEELDHPEFQELFKKHRNLIIEHDIWTYRVLLAADLVICLGGTSVGLESLLANKKVLYYDVTGWKRHIYAPYSNILVSFTEPEFRNNLDRVLQAGEYIDRDTLDRIRFMHGFRYDGCVVQRLRQVCASLIEEEKISEMSPDLPQ
jgi:hypothetical protein